MLLINSQKCRIIWVNNTRCRRQKMYATLLAERSSGCATSVPIETLNGIQKINLIALRTISDRDGDMVQIVRLGGGREEQCNNNHYTIERWYKAYI